MDDVQKQAEALRELQAKVLRSGIPEPWARSFVAEIVYDIDRMEDKVLVWPDENPEECARMMHLFPNQDRHYFLVDVVLLPADIP